MFFFFQAEDGIRDLVRSRGLGDVYKRQQYARDAKSRVLFCTHHEPTRSDDALDEAFRQALISNPRRPGDPDIRLACEGETFEF